MGAWRAIRHRLEEAKPDGVPLLYVGRPWRASPSEGYPTAHLREQDRIVRAALAPSALSRSAAAALRRAAHARAASPPPSGRACGRARAPACAASAAAGARRRRRVSREADAGRGGACRGGACGACYLSSAVAVPVAVIVAAAVAVRRRARRRRTAVGRTAPAVDRDGRRRGRSRDRRWRPVPACSPRSQEPARRPACRRSRAERPWPRPCSVVAGPAAARGSAAGGALPFGRSTSRGRRSGLVGAGAGADRRRAAAQAGAGGARAPAWARRRRAPARRRGGGARLGRRLGRRLRITIGGGGHDRGPATGRASGRARHDRRERDGAGRRVRGAGAALGSRGGAAPGSTIAPPVRAAAPSRRDGRCVVRVPRHVSECSCPRHRTGEKDRCNEPFDTPHVRPRRADNITRTRYRRMGIRTLSIHRSEGRRSG